MPRSVADADTIQGIHASSTPNPKYLLALGTGTRFDPSVLFKNIITVTSDYSVSINDYTLLCDSSTASLTLYLPTAVGISGALLRIKKIDSSTDTITIQPAGTETIQGASSVILSQQDEIIDIQSDGIDWRILSRTNTANQSVSSVFGRTGSVNAASGDYTVSQILGAAASGANGDITSLGGLTTALSKGQGGTGNTTGNAASVIGKVPTATPTADAIPIADTSGKLEGWTTPKLQTEDLFADFVVSGLLPATSTSLISDISAGVAYVMGLRVVKVVTSHTYIASTDTYVDLNSVGTYTFVEVANGAVAPAITTDSIRLAKVVTDATAITSVADMANRPQIYVDSDGNVGINGSITLGPSLQITPSYSSSVKQTLKDLNGYGISIYSGWDFLSGAFLDFFGQNNTTGGKVPGQLSFSYGVQNLAAATTASFFSLVHRASDTGVTNIFYADYNSNIGIGTIDQFGGGVKVIGIVNAITVPSSNPTGGGVLFVDAGALTYRGSSGTVTVIAPA